MIPTWAIGQVATDKVAVSIAIRLLKVKILMNLIVDKKTTKPIKYPYN